MHNVHSPQSKVGGGWCSKVRGNGTKPHIGRRVPDSTLSAAYLGRAEDVLLRKDKACWR
jgi:hypothetical protein